jgi:hypothetical protein
VYSGWPYDEVQIAKTHRTYFKAAFHLGLAYALTGRQAYASKCAEILLGYADRYKTYPIHNVYGKPSPTGGRLFAQTLGEASAIIDAIWAYDLIYSANVLSEEQRRKIEYDFFREVVAVIRRHDGGMSNWQSWHNAAIGAIGLCLQDDELVDLAINGKSGIRFQLDNSVASDGFWYEGTPSYHFYALEAILRLGLMAKTASIDLFGHPKFKALFDAPLELAMPDNVLPALNDSGTHKLSRRSYLYDMAFGIWPDRHYLPVAGSRKRQLDGLLFGAEGLPKASTVPLTSRDFSGIGVAVLRTGEQGHQSYLLMDYGPHGGSAKGHGHPDKLNIIFFAHGLQIVPDPGSGLYGTSVHRNWYRQTLAHNTVVIDAKRQNIARGKLVLFETSGSVQAIRATCDNAYPGVEFDRTLVLLEDGFVDVFRVQCEQERTIDWVYHNRGTLEQVASNAVIPQEGKMGKDAGYQHFNLIGKLLPKEDFSISWKVGAGQFVKLHQNRIPDSEVYIGDGIGNPVTERVPMVVTRCKARQTVFVSFIETFNDTSDIQAIRLIDVTEDGRKADIAETLGVEVQRLSGTELIIVGTRDGTLKQVGKFSTRRRVDRFISQ